MNDKPIDKDFILLTLNEKWKCNIPFGWFPIFGDDEIPGIEIFESNYFSFFVEQVKSIIKDSYFLNTLLEIREDGQIKEMSVDESDFCYDGLEYIYTDVNFNLFYTFHMRIPQPLVD